MVQGTGRVEEGTSSANTSVLRHKDDFYRDGFRVVWLSIGMIIAAIGLLITVSLYFFLHQVLPITFSVYEGYRVQPDIPLDRPYLRIPDLSQWVSSALPALFATDFISYADNLKEDSHYFTAQGWPKYMDVVSTFLNHDDILTKKQFISAKAAGAPVVLNQGIVEGKYAWWVQMPINVRYSGVGGGDADAKEAHLIIQVLVVRVPTLNNLDGVGIENLIVNRK